MKSATSPSFYFSIIIPINRFVFCSPSSSFLLFLFILYSTLLRTSRQQRHHQLQHFNRCIHGINQQGQDFNFHDGISIKESLIESLHNFSIESVLYDGFRLRLGETSLLINASPDCYTIVIYLIRKHTFIPYSCHGRFYKKY